MSSKKSSNKNRNKKYSKRDEPPPLQFEKDYPRREIVDSDRKFVPSSDSEDEAPDYDYLLKLPPSVGSHFLLASEQQKFHSDPEFSTSHFKVDTKLLNIAIKSIPFNERFAIEGIEWLPEELGQMVDLAATNEEIYRLSLEESLAAKPVAKPHKEPTTSTTAPTINSMPVEIQSQPQTDKESIQKWLDDILDV